MPPNFSSTWRAWVIARRTIALHAWPSPPFRQDAEPRKSGLGDRFLAGFFGGTIPWCDPVTALAPPAVAIAPAAVTEAAVRTIKQKFTIIRIPGIRPPS